jgi:hypothetical protein
VEFGSLFLQELAERVVVLILNTVLGLEVVIIEKGRVVDSVAPAIGHA